MVEPRGARPRRPCRGAGGGRLRVAPRLPSGNRRGADRVRGRRAGGGGARSPRHSPHPRPQRGGRPLRPRLRPCPGPAVADGDEPPDRSGAARRGAGGGRRRYRPAASGARSPPPGDGLARLPRARVAAPDRRLRQRGQRVARDEGRAASARVPHRRVRARAVDGGRHRGLGQGDGPRPRTRVVARPHAASDVGVPRPGADPRLLHALPRGQAERRPAPRPVLGHAGERETSARCRRRPLRRIGARVASFRRLHAPGPPVHRGGGVRAPAPERPSRLE